MPNPTPQAQSLFNALRQRKIYCELEKWDEDKHIDLTIPWARIDIEVDGIHHYTDPEQIISDFDRSYWSITRDDYDTIHIPNIIVDKYLDKIADALAVAARKRHKDIKDSELGVLEKLKRFILNK